MPLQAVLFDLDGTLLDTAPDLVSACNAALVEAGQRALPHDDLKPYISGGASAMLRHALTINACALPIEPLLERMLAVYEDNIAVHTRLFDGMEAVLDELEARGLAWGIVTNKVTRFTEPLLRALDLSQRPGCVVSGDTCAESKPHPLPMLEACRRIGRAPETCVYIGDARRDIEAGHNAGMSTLAARYGYVPADDPAHRWGAHGLLDRPEDLLNWLEERS
ncbi:phosphoglycolate phosphatase [Methylococcus sp. EFPC2]|nr:phosphoglycolate phosphatase [Methylococcus sp. EFPC2]